MEVFLTVIHVLAALFMIVVILIQGGNQGGIGAAFGGGNSQGVFGASGATSFLGKITYAIAAVFMVTSIGLSMIQGTTGRTGLTDRLEEQAGMGSEPVQEQPILQDDTDLSPQPGGSSPEDQ